MWLAGSRLQHASSFPIVVGTIGVDVPVLKRRRTWSLLSIPRTANCPFDRREQGVLLQGFNDFKEGDILQAYEVTYLTPEL
jgi:hypothetical protein